LRETHGIFHIPACLGLWVFMVYVRMVFGAAISPILQTCIAVIAKLIS
jgi:hypothetical protein